MSDKIQLSVKDYGVAWISALAIEQAAGTVMLDEEHEVPHDFQPDSQDGNLYTFGRIASHNVVLTCLTSGKYGLTSAAWTAANVLRRFPMINVGLLVGIGGGVPSRESDIRLGDVAVSVPQGDLPGVVQYDMGKQQSNGFRRSGQLNSPPSLLLKAVAMLRAREALGQIPISQSLSIFNLLPGNPFAREKAGCDVLYDHCGNEQLRTPRQSSVPICHYGTIASGNWVIKDARVRDQISRNLGGVLCFEMEAAGLMDHFPCLVIRGICDYADLHKNDTWQPYAAAAAAAYARSILSTIPGGKSQNESVADNAMSSEDLQNIDELFGGPRRGYRRVRGAVKQSESTQSVNTPFGEDLANPKTELPQILQRLLNPRLLQSKFVLFNRTMHFYGETYIGNGSILKNVINNQGGVIRNSGGTMNVVGNVTGSFHSKNILRQTARGYSTGNYHLVARNLCNVKIMRRFLKKK